MASDTVSNTLVLLLCFQMSLITCVIRSDRVCLELQLGKQDIQAIGLLTRRFVLLTKQGYVYDLPSNVFHPSDCVLYLSDDVLLKDKWPLLDKYIESNQSVVALSDAEHDYILTMKQSDKKTSLYAYNIDNDTMFTTSTKLPYNNQSISSSEKLIFYSVQIAIGQPANKQIQVHICNLTGSAEINGTTGKIESSVFLCINEDSIAMLSAMPSEHTVCASNVTFHSGFTDGQQFYLFMDSSVYIFEHSTFITGKLVSGHKVELKDFFVCGRLGTSNNVMKWFTDVWLINMSITLLFIYSLIIYVHCIHPLVKNDNQGASSRKQSSHANLKLSPKSTNATIITKQRGSDQNITADRKSSAANRKNK